MEAEPSNSPVQVGDVIAGKYRVERVIGRGGIGVVVAAHHLSLDEPVALKFIGVNLAAEREVVQRLLREARATFRLRSQHTVRVLDADELPSGAVYIVMELLDGHDLRTELATRGPLPELEVVRHVLQACDALEEAHALGIVHRDLKPHNLFLAQQRRGPPIVKVLDFGMSKIDPTFFEAGPLTLPETALGTPRYMAPEQWRSASTVDHRADVWGLGVVMYELMTGRVPLQGMPLGERQARLLAGAIPSPRELRLDVSDAVARVIGRCLKADPASRWRTVTHLATALRDAHPGASSENPRTEVTLSAVTAVVPTKDMHAQAARAFAVAGPESHGRQAGRPTLPDSPIAIEEAAVEDPPDSVTVVRPPMFTPAELAVDALPSPAVEKPRVGVGTLRSAGPLLGVNESLPPLAKEDTLRLPGVPPHRGQPIAAGSVPPATPTAQTFPGPIAAPSQPVAPPAPPPQRLSRRRMSTVAVVVAVALTAMSLGALVAWIMGR